MGFQFHHSHKPQENSSVSSFISILGFHDLMDFLWICSTLSPITVDQIQGQEETYIIYTS